MKEMVLKIPRLDDKTIAQYTSKKVYTTPKSSGRARGRPRKTVNQQLPEVLNIEEEPQREYKILKEVHFWTQEIKVLFFPLFRS